MINGLDLLLVIIALAAVGVIWTYSDWRNFDRHRRTDRLVHRNLRRMAGR